LKYKYFFSIAIPFFYRNKYSLQQLKRCVKSIKSQTFTNYEILISSQNCYEYLYENSFFKGIKILNGKSASFIQANLNIAIKNCNGKWIKIIFSDDYFFDKFSLSKMYNSLVDSRINWACSNSLHFNKRKNQIYKPLISFYNKNILEINTIGSPSSLVIRNNNPILFDQRTWMRLDVDYYHSLYSNFGKPLYINDVFVVNEIHDDQFSNLMINKSDQTKNLLKKELDYLCRKHKYKKLNFAYLLIYKIWIKLQRLILGIIFNKIYK
tara:strand:+ start:427 stop:1224 length:798 start_codon:yes stop_codon:yes gene_type:complete